MKKLVLGTLLITALVFSLVFLGCGGDSGGGGGKDTTPPVLMKAQVFEKTSASDTTTERTLVLTFSEPVVIKSASSRASDGGEGAGDGGSSSVDDDKYGGLSLNGNEFAGDIVGIGTATWKILLKDAVTDSKSVSISYDEDGIITDKADNALLEFGGWPVMFGPPDNKKPTLDSALVIRENTNDYYLILIFSEPITADNPDVKLSLSGATISLEDEPSVIDEAGAVFKFKLVETNLTAASVFTISYTKSSPLDVRDYSGNYLENFKNWAVENKIGDTTDPYLISAVVLNSAPNKLILTFSEPVFVKESGGDGHGDESDDIGWVFDVDGGNEILFTGEPPEGLGSAVWTVTLNGHLTAGMRAWINYHHGGAETVDYAGNDLHEINGRPVANRVGLDPDTTPPTLVGAYMTNKGGDTGDQPWMIMVFSEPVIMAGGDDDESGGWSVTGIEFDEEAGDEFQIDSEIWLIKLKSIPAIETTATISYNASRGACYDLSGNKLTNVTKNVVNKTDDNDAPTITSITAKIGTKFMVINFSEPVMWLDMGGGDGEGDGGGGFTFTGLTWADQPEGNGTNKWTIPLTTVVTSTTTATLAYDADAPGAITIIDFNANPLATFEAKTVTIQN